MNLTFSDRLLKSTLLFLIPQRVRPNHLTVFRMLATPFVFLLIWRENYIWGIPVFLLVALTDALDGALARVRNQITDWGRLFDPLADKLLIGSLVVAIVWTKLDPWLAGVILFLEMIFITTGWRRHKKGLIIEANRWGKIKMILQVAGILILLIGLLLPWPYFFHISRLTFILAILFAIISLLTYGI